jgi:hypothetical protein
MGKKNPFVTTVGFNRHDPAHVEVAQFLNGMERGKAQYIVDAVLAYQKGRQAEGFISAGKVLDYAAIRQIVLQVMEERENGTYGCNIMAEAMQTAERAETFGGNGLAELDDAALGDILQSLEVFKR